MDRSRRLLGSLLVVTACLLVGTGCGGGDDSASPFNAAGANDDSGSADSSGSSDTVASDAPDTAGSTDSVGSSGSGVPASFADKLYPTGTGHLEISGEKGAKLDFPDGGGYVQDGALLLAFGTTDGSLGVTLASGSQDAVVIGTSELSGGGEIGKECEVDVTQNDDSGVAGTFSCSNVTLLVVTSGDLVKADLQGSFSVSAEPA